MSTANQSTTPDVGSAINRRRLLSWLWQLPLAAVALQTVGMLFSFALPRRTAGSFGTVIDIGPLAELPASGSGPVHHSRGRFWLVNDQEGATALSHTCSHLDCLFTWDGETGRFVCPCHGSQFDRQGRVLNGPANRSLDRYPLQIISPDGQILAHSDDQGGPLPIPTPETPAAGQVEGAEPDTASMQPPRLAVDTGRRITTGSKPA